MRCPSWILVLMSLSVLPAAPGADVPDPNAGGGTTAEPAPAKGVGQKEAEQLVTLGKQAMQESNDKPSRSVDAAVAFSKAIKYYEIAGDIDKVCDLEANIFWCKKRMDVDDVKTFVAQKGGDQSVKDALAKADAVATKTVPKEEAQNYFNRAEKFSKEHPEDLDGIIAHYIEVAERFTGSETAIKAQKLSIEAQNKQRAQFKAQQEAQRETLFSRPSKPASGVQQAAVPAADAAKASAQSVRKLYKEEYAKTKPNQKRRLVAKLMEQVPQTKDDPATQYALLTESIDMATSVTDWYTVFEACDLMGTYFTGVDAKAKKKECYAKSRGNATVQSILKLLDNPEDGEANSVVGKYFCFEGNKWDVGLPLLAHGADAEYKGAAEMELLKPSGVQQQVELADKWYDLGKKARSPAKEGMLARAFSWYKQAQPTVTGISKDRIKQRLEEIDGLLPMTNLDYDNLTPKQWDRLRGNIVEVSAAKDRNDINVSMVKGQRLRIVPHPTDTWATDYYGDLTTTNWKGTSANHSLYYSSRGDFSIGALVVQLDNGKQMKPGVIEGQGRLFLGPYSSGWGAGGKGIIRCKLMPAEDD
jgi:hypothetical protein